MQTQAGRLGFDLLTSGSVHAEILRGLYVYRLWCW